VLHINRFTNTKSKTYTNPHKSSHGSIKKEVLNCFLLRTKATFCTPLPMSLSLVNTTPFLRYQRKILIFKRILALHAQQLTGVPALKTMSLYIFLTENFLLAVQMKESLRSLRVHLEILGGHCKIVHLCHYKKLKITSLY
jgi:hypothetical protein